MASTAMLFCFLHIFTYISLQIVPSLHDFIKIFAVTQMGLVQAICPSF